MTDSGTENEPGLRLISTGAEIAGGIAGAGIGLVVAGPPGAILGAALAPMTKNLLQVAADYARRRLSTRETVRVGGFILFASERVEKNLAAGLPLRMDGWFDPTRPGGRTPADELADATARIASEQAQERKVRYLGNIIGNLAFAQPVDVVTAHRAIRTAEELTFTQYELLALCNARRDLLPKIEKDETLQDTWEVRSVYEELADLGYFQRELIVTHGKKFQSLPPAEMTTSSRAALLASLMDLDDMPLDELHEAAGPLWIGCGLVPPWEAEGAPEARS